MELLRGRRESERTRLGSEKANMHNEHCIKKRKDYYMNYNYYIMDIIITMCKGITFLPIFNYSHLIAISHIRNIIIIDIN